MYGYLTGGKNLSKTTFIELGLPLPEFIGEFTPLVIIVFLTTTAVTMNVSVGIYNALLATKKKPAFTVLLGLMPVVMFTFDFWLLYAYSDWAWTHGGYAILMQTPIISLLTCK